MGVLLYGALHAIIRAQQLRTLSIEKNTATIHANSVLQHLQYLAILVEGKRFFLNEAWENASYVFMQYGRAMTIDESPPNTPPPTIYQQYIGITRENALPGEIIVVAFPSWGTQMVPNNSGYAYCKIYIMWQSTVPVVDQTVSPHISSPEYDATMEFLNQHTNQKIMLDGYLRFTNAGY
ncbi:MAG TPA: hypothetical protein PL155_08900 [Candidatus Omnitrophota bacterium]|nr:hypothetical protein [Candidatus Omnitrophota bacterium]HPD85426.1 hypothetical protein [Candidatus Omnitrophota bacterium]HRZ04073.1 hypothetical protein [Candidatus Omnitrophota bacterium]